MVGEGKSGLCGQWCGGRGQQVNLASSLGGEWGWDRAGGVRMELYSVLLPAVDQLVFDQLWQLAESFPTCRAVIGLHEGVDPLVLVEDWMLTGGLPALTAHIWPFTSVDYLILNKVWTLAEALTAFSTHIWLLSVVNFLVNRNKKEQSLSSKVSALTNM